LGLLTAFLAAGRFVEPLELHRDILPFGFKKLLELQG